MREDMFKVIVERPRKGGWGKQRGCEALDEHARSHESIKHRHVDRKWLNENLNPLQRWLAAQAGRPWDKVYSELCARIDRRSTVQQHILQHLEDFVAVRVVEIDGVLHSHWGGEPRPFEQGWRYVEFYVDPCTGILRRNRKALPARLANKRLYLQRKFPPVPADRRDLAPDRQLHRLDGLWFEVALAPIPRDGTTPAFDVVLHRPAREFLGDHSHVPANVRLYGKAGWYAAGRRQLGRRELAQYGLHNEA